MLATACAALSGCAQLGFTLPKLGGEDVTQARNERKQQLIEEYESRRSAAMFQAALGRWKQGDAKGCESVLGQLLAREPGHREAHLLYAEVCSDRRDYPAANEHLDAVLNEHPDDAEALHARGLLLDIAGVLLVQVDARLAARRDRDSPASR